MGKERGGEERGRGEGHMGKEREERKGEGGREGRGGGGGEGHMGKEKGGREEEEERGGEEKREREGRGRTYSMEQIVPIVVPTHQRCPVIGLEAGEVVGCIEATGPRIFVEWVAMEVEDQQG